MMVLAATYGALEGLPLTTVSFRIYGKNDFFDRYRDGEVSPTIDNYFAMVEKFRERWPERGAWPELEPIPKLGKNPGQPEKADAVAEGIR